MYRYMYVGRDTHHNERHCIFRFAPREITFTNANVRVPETLYTCMHINMLVINIIKLWFNLMCFNLMVYDCIDSNGY